MSLFKGLFLRLPKSPCWGAFRLVGLPRRLALLLHLQLETVLLLENLLTRLPGDAILCCTRAVGPLSSLCNST
jgi:hypothetical protein